ncbi:MAG: TraR/DksA family transcriptional regulator [Betaproteobacteria bacterium]|nr:TraR/DksA family transcriptional regulator [Betaproteobacteria bacterium]MCC7217367.1 TraR/DksA family transcriptional regulator [Burkholderiales bacterium]
MKGLKRTQVERLEKLLQAQRRASLEEAEAELKLVHEQSVADVAGEVADTGDESVAMLLTDLNNTMAQRHVDEIRAIDSALAHIRSDEFGYCADCGGDIPFERLKAFPTATRCTACQTKREHTFAHASTPRL